MSTSVYGGLRSARWLRQFRYGPLVVGFRNLETGQVVWSQTLAPQQYYLDRQFRWPNWQNRKPNLRKDIWRCLAVAEVPTHEQAVQLYRNLVRLRELRDMEMRNQARDWRRKNEFGNIWYWNQYRPTYTQEAVADVISALEVLKVPAKLWWDGDFRRGAPEYWDGLEVEQAVLPRHSPREQFAVLNRLRIESLSRAARDQAERTRSDIVTAEQARSAGEPTASDLRRQFNASVAERYEKIVQARQRQQQALFASRPELKDLADKRAAIDRITASLKEAEAAYDHFLPHGERGAAKAPIKLRKLALRQAKRVYRAALKRYQSRNNKRRVPQSRSRFARR